MANFIKSIDALAKQIALELDKKDGNPDGKIDSNTWNNIFNAKEKGGKGIKRHISVFNAEKSIISYLKKTSTSTEEKNNVGLEWLENLKNPKQEPTSAEQPKDEEPHNKVSSTNDIEPINPTQITEPAVSTYVCRIPDVVVTGDASRIKTQASDAFNQITSMSITPEIESLIRQELVKKGVDESKVDIKYWAERIARVSSKFSIPKEIIVSIISKETLFTKNISNSFGKGAMALTGIAIRSFFPNGQGNWNDIYQQLDNNLLQDILYKKDANGKLITDSNGKPILKYKSSQELLIACGKDDELSMKVGSLIFEMKYAEAVATYKYGRATYANLPNVIKQLKSGEIKLTENENIACVGLAVKNYNGCNKVVKRNGKYVTIKDDYKRDVMDSLKVQGYNFAEQNIIKRS